MGSLKQDVYIASCINQDAMYQAVGDLYCDYHGIIMWLNCVVDIFLRENNFGRAGYVLGSIADSKYLLTSTEPGNLLCVVLS